MNVKHLTRENLKRPLAHRLHLETVISVADFIPIEKLAGNSICEINQALFDEIHAQVAPEIEKLRVADDYASGRGRIETQGYAALVDGNKKYQWKFGFAHNVAPVVNDDLASENSPEWAIMKEQEKIAENLRAE